MSKYIDLLKESKESRIMDILRETEKFLKEIAVRITLSKVGKIQTRDKTQKNNEV